MSDGIRVEVMYIPKMSADAREMVNAGGKLLKPKIECAAYQFILTKPLDLPHLLLLKTFTEDKSSVYQVFNNHPKLIELIVTSTSRLPEDVLAFEFTPHKISLLWRESDDSESVYQGVLGILREAKEYFEDSENRGNRD